MIHLRQHSTYSIRRAYGKPKDFLLRAEELGLEYLSITEYANDHSWPYFRSEINNINKKRKENGEKLLDIKLLYGVEYFITQDMTSKGRPDFEDINAGNDTIIFMAKNNKGYVELLKILSEANLPEHYFVKPRIDFDYVSELNGENLLCIIPYDFGTIPKLLIQGEKRQAKMLLGLFQEVFGEDIYFEVSANISETNKLINQKIIEFAKENNIKCIASCNVHYPNKEDKKVHDVVLAIGEKKTFAQNDLYSLGADDHYLRDVDSVRQGLHQNGVQDDLIEELINNTKEVAVKCDFELEIAPMALPNTDVILPDEYKGDPERYFKDQIEIGWQELIVPRIDSGEWDEIKSEDLHIYEQRREYEYNMIKNIFTMRDPNHPMKNGFIDYFLIVADYIKWAKGIDRRIMKDAPIIDVGPARGSVSGSLIGYLMRMSTVDPIPWGLTFERFINPERVNWPDIDMDFDPDYAWWVEKYLIETYGEEHVAHILTFQTAAGKKAFNDVSKVLSGKYGKYKTEVKQDKWVSQNELKRLLDMDARTAREIQDMIDSSVSFKELINPDSEHYIEELGELSRLSAYKELFEIVSKIEGEVTSIGSHPGAVIITKEPLYYHTSRVNNGKYEDGSIMMTTSYEKYALEDVNTMKFDILRLRELTIVRETKKFIKESLGIDVNLDRINPFDIETNLKMLELMKEKDLDGIFQFSSNLYKNIIEEVLSGLDNRDEREVAKDLFNIIVALEALGRPGPLEGGMVPTFAKGLADPENNVEKIHPVVDKILEETYGNMLYQEQILFILRQLAGFSLGQADMVRRGIAATKIELIEEHRGNFLKGVEKVQLENNPNTPPEEMEKLLKLANHIFDLMTKWAGYGFNKAHSVGYGFLTLRGLYLKANYRTHFMAALMSAQKDEERISKYIEEIRAKGIRVLPPKINKSLKGFTVVGEDILFGLEAIKGVGAKAVEKIISNYPYKNFMEFVQKAGNRTIIPPLIKAGYFEEDKRFLLKYWEVFIEIKDGKTKSDESLVEYLLENGITEDNQEDVEKRLENIIYEKSLKKRTERTRQACLDLIHREEWTNMALMNAEKEVLGLYLSESPLDQYKDMIINHTVLSRDFKDYKMNQEFYIIGLILETPPKRKDKNGNEMCFLKLQMYDGIIEIPVFAHSYEKYFFHLVGGNIIIAMAKKIRGGITLNKITSLEQKYEQFKKYFEGMKK